VYEVNIVDLDTGEVVYTHQIDAMKLFEVMNAAIEKHKADEAHAQELRKELRRDIDKPWDAHEMFDPEWVQEHPTYFDREGGYIIWNEWDNKGRNLYD